MCIGARLALARPTHGVSSEPERPVPASMYHGDGGRLGALRML